MPPFSSFLFISESLFITRCKDIRTFSRKKSEFSAFLTNLKDKIRTDKATFRDKEDRIGFLFRSLEGKARKTLETRYDSIERPFSGLAEIIYLLTKTKDDSLSYEDFCSYVKDSVYYRKRDAAVKRLDAELVLVSPVPLVDFQGRLASPLAEKKLLLDYAARKLVWPNDLPALAKYSLSILLPKTPLLNRQIDLAV
ncbi:hypothetical protein L249_1543 [Ophiocordyceps polyrhachis-furcata BCC 54312]|uniref:Uncharacterized protein n=1 Tax=Ophiocordyceps polyrhachis-furcata BCC 54312 TaxID=1330021 RepID=A0A367L4J3_9HYPO|nr:hypothetical protein L249_1543 [Ophiocordyceps polyrhachis-furcata BCC 54312]